MADKAALALTDHEGLKVLEGPPDAAWMAAPREATAIVEACFEGGTRAVLLYAGNLPDRFFDLSSGQAGDVLQKLRNYRVRLAVVCPPGAVAFSSRFGEMAAEERQRSSFAIFETREDARAWLAGASRASGE